MHYIRKDIRAMIHPLALIVFLMVSTLTLMMNYLGHYADRLMDDKKRELSVSLSTLTDIRQNLLNSYLQEHISSTESIAENITVKVYLTEFGDNQTFSEDQLVQSEFVSNYLRSEALKAGLYAASQTAGEKMPANIPANTKGALLIYNTNHDVLASAGVTPYILDILKEHSHFRSSLETRTLLHTDGSVHMIATAPIKAIQSETITGYIVSIRQRPDILDEKIRFPVIQAVDYLESALYVRQKNELHRLTHHETPLFPSSLSYQKNNPTLEFDAIENSGIILEGADSSNTNVMLLARPLVFDEWFLLSKVTKNEAMASTLSAQKQMHISALLIVAGMTLTMLLIWRHSSSRKYQQLSRKYARKNQLLRLVTQNQIQEMFILDKHNIVRFVNRAFVSSHNSTIEALVDKPLQQVVGGDRAHEYASLVSSMKCDLTPVVVTRRIKDAETQQERYTQTKLIPLIDHRDMMGDYNESANDYETPIDGILVVENDVTDILNDRLKYERYLDKTVDLMVRIIEQRSAYYHNHSRHVFQLSIAVAKDMNLNETQMKAISIASRIANLHLVLLPADIINKQGKLNKQEQEILESSLDKTIDMVRDVYTDIPVLETLSHLSENFDGSGEKGLSGDEIILTAQILKACNDFIAMLSSRAYREPLSFDEAVEEIFTYRNSRYADAIVFSVVNAAKKLHLEDTFKS